MAGSDAVAVAVAGCSVAAGSSEASAVESQIEAFAVARAPS